MRVHLAQMFYSPAYYSETCDFLQEPFPELGVPLATCQEHQAVSDFRMELREGHIVHLREKLQAVVEWSLSREADLLVLPEYSVPADLLPFLRSLTEHKRLTVVAGTHRVALNDRSQAAYEDIGASPLSFPAGHACVPVLHADGRCDVVLKARKSRYEPDLKVPDTEDYRPVRVTCRDGEVAPVLLVCVDAIDPGVLGSRWQPGNQGPRLIICPSRSPSSDPFLSLFKYLQPYRAFVLYANSADYGGTAALVPEAYERLLAGPNLRLKQIPARNEGVVELDLLLPCLQDPTINPTDTMIGYHPRIVPIVYGQDAVWLDEYRALKNLLVEALTVGDTSGAREILSDFLTQAAASLPLALEQSLKHLLHHVLAAYSEDLEVVRSLMECVEVLSPALDTRVWRAISLERSRQLLIGLLSNRDVDVEPITDCLKSVTKEQKRLPPITLTEKGVLVRATPGAEPVNVGFASNEDLLAVFQNRGPELDEIHNAFGNNSIRLFLITGVLGIGKTDFINTVFKKVFADWEVLRVAVPVGASGARLLAEIGARLGIDLDVDSLAHATHKIFRRRARDVFTAFYTRARRALVIDDLAAVLRQGSVRDHQLVRMLLEEAEDPVRHQGGRVFMLSSVRIPEGWFSGEQTYRLHLRGVHHRYTRRIIENQMRRLQLVSEEEPPDIPQEIVDLVDGHPLAARLSAEAFRDGARVAERSQEVLDLVAGRLAEALLNHVELAPEDEITMEKLAVFRLPIRREILLRIGMTERELESVVERCAVGFDGEAYEIHEAVRRHFYRRAQGKKTIQAYHSIAVRYYEKLLAAERSHVTVLAELAHHLALAGEMERARDLRVLVIDELKPVARSLYRDSRRYQEALDLFRMLAEMVPDDPAVLAYVGRCYARLGIWGDSDRAFEAAIEAARRPKQPVWWLYRDWGHIKARYGYEADADALFAKAEEDNPRDASMIANKAFMRWKNGDTEAASRLFRQAYEIDPRNEYTLVYYAKFLDEMGQQSKARQLEIELRVLELADDYTPPVEHALDPEYDD